MFTVTPPTKRPLSPSAPTSSSFGGTNKTPRTSFSFSPSVSDHLLRQKLASLPRNRLESLIIQLAQFNPQSKQSILSLLPTLTPKTIREFHTTLEPVLALLQSSHSRKNARGLWAVAEKINDRLQDAIATIIGVVQEYLSDDNVGTQEKSQTWVNGIKALTDLGVAVHNSDGEIRQSLMSLGSGEDVAEAVAVLIPGLKGIEYSGQTHAKVVDLRMALGGLGKQMRAYGNEEWVKPLSKLDAVMKRWVKGGEKGNPGSQGGNEASSESGNSEEEDSDEEL